jgi:hypothetical protein
MSSKNSSLSCRAWFNKSSLLDCVMLLVVVVEAVDVGVGAPMEGGGGAVEPNGFRSRRGSLLLEEARLTRVASFLLRRKSSRARCEAIVIYWIGSTVESTGSFNIRRVVVGRVAGFPNENGGGGQEHRVNTKEVKPTRALILVGCTFVKLERTRCKSTSEYR